jgi:hypothetical protein
VPGPLPGPQVPRLEPVRDSRQAATLPPGKDDKGAPAQKGDLTPPVDNRSPRPGHTPRQPSYGMPAAATSSRSPPPRAAACSTCTSPCPVGSVAIRGNCAQRAGTAAILQTALRGVRSADRGAASAASSAAAQLGSSIGAALLNTIAATAAAGYLAGRAARPGRQRELPPACMATRSRWPGAWPSCSPRRSPSSS